MENIILVEFPTSYKEYAFRNDIEGIEVGDKVVVDTSNGFVVAEVTKVDVVSNKASKYVVQKIDIEAHEKRIEKANKLIELKAKMEDRRKKLQEIEIYQILAKEDDEMAALLAEYGEIQK
ncbi:hypothetical protein [Bacillus amyloliquefaciens]|uniref:hypothetical protein n=1 Tax=Bacillus subtilis group TaxID=653685 RepID=UPI0005EDA22A|nr:hypothetical protein [Bacillus amyloliquefaciens]